jgi:hypothetical protein
MKNGKCYKYEDHLEHMDWVVGPRRRTDTRVSHIEGGNPPAKPSNSGGMPGCGYWIDASASILGLWYCVLDKVVCST